MAEAELRQALEQKEDLQCMTQCDLKGIDGRVSASNGLVFDIPAAGNRVKALGT